MEREDELVGKLQELQKQLGKKQMFEEAVSSIRSLLREFYPSASPSVQKSFYVTVCRVATILKTRYTAPGFWMVGMKLFVDAQNLVSDLSERDHLGSCISQAQEHLHEVQDQPEVIASAQNGRNQGYLFEGHLTVDSEPPQPEWLVQSNLLETAVANLVAAESSQGQNANSDTLEDTANLFRELVDRLNHTIPMILENTPVAPRAPPASKEVVAKLPVIIVTEDILTKLGSDVECAICRESLVVGDKMQELPCKHTFHPPCLKPWLDEHNSCPICRHELLTDDHAYESWKEREKEAEEERKGAANALRGGEFMYV